MMSSPKHLEDLYRNLPECMTYKSETKKAHSNSKYSNNDGISFKLFKLDKNIQNVKLLPPKISNYKFKNPKVSFGYDGKTNMNTEQSKNIYVYQSTLSNVNKKLYQITK